MLRRWLGLRTAIGHAVSQRLARCSQNGSRRHWSSACRRIPTAPHVMTQQALRFGRQLKGRFGLPVLWVDERYSSVSAAAQRDAAPLDAIAARIILQQFFDEYAR